MNQLEAGIHNELKQVAMNNGATQNGNGRPEPKEDLPPLIISMDQIKAEKVDWLWPNRIPIGRLTLLDGDPGSGKSSLSLAIASAISTGAVLPFGVKSLAPANVLLMSCEDGYSDTVRPRLDQLGADVTKITIPNPQRGLAPSLMLQSNFIEQAVKIVAPVLVIIDPFIAYTGKSKTKESDEMRQLLTPLMSLAERYSFAFLVIRHFTKQTDLKAIHRGAGAIDIIAAARSAFIIVESDEEPNMRVLAQIKNSLGPKSPSLSFYINDQGFRWGKAIETDAEQLLSANRTETRKREKVQLEAAKQFLEEALSKGPVASNDVKEKADEAGLAWRTVWRAKEALAVKSSKDRGTGEWFWGLP